MGDHTAVHGVVTLSLGVNGDLSSGGVDGGDHCSGCVVVWLVCEVVKCERKLLDEEYSTYRWWLYSISPVLRMYLLLHCSIRGTEFIL